jgi:hypothetical protein
MLTASMLTGLIQAGASGQALLAAAVLLFGAAAVGGLIHRRVRGNGNAQLASAAAMSLAGAPIALLAGVDPARVLATALGWVAIFLTSALIVRGTFARARSASIAHNSASFYAASIGLSALASAAFVALGFRGAAAATALSTLCAAALVAARPTVKQLKRVGLALAALSLVASVLLAV